MQDYIVLLDNWPRSNERQYIKIDHALGPKDACVRARGKSALGRLVAAWPDDGREYHPGDRVCVSYVDMESFQGRALHPETEDENRVGVIIGWTCRETPDEEDPENFNDFYIVQLDDSRRFIEFSAEELSMLKPALNPTPELPTFKKYVEERMRTHCESKGGTLGAVAHTDHKHCVEVGKCWQDTYPCPALREVDFPRRSPAQTQPPNTTLSVDLDDRQASIVAWALRRATSDPHFYNTHFKQEILTMAGLFDERALTLEEMAKRRS